MGGMADVILLAGPSRQCNGGGTGPLVQATSPSKLITLCSRWTWSGCAVRIPSVNVARSVVRAVGLRLARWLGATVVDQRTGQPLGRALFLPWRGRVVVIGLGEWVPPVRAVFLPQERLTYWKQEIGFATVPEPDFPSEAESEN